MKRLSLHDAFVGESNPHQEGIAVEDGDEVVLLAVRGGEITAVVEADTPDDLVLTDALVIRGALRLENERVLTFEIHSGASGAFCEDEAADLHRRRLEGAGASLSTVGDAAYMERPTSGPPPAGGRPGTARDIMSSPVVTVRPDEPVSAVAAALSFHGISGVPVVDARGTLVGVVSEADVVDRSGRTAADLMSSPVYTISEDTPIEEIAAELARRRIKRISVVRGDQLTGVVSRGDIVRWLSGVSNE